MEHAFGTAPFALGIEEELLLVAAAPPHALDHRASEAVMLLDSHYVKPDVYEAMVECATSICRSAPDAVYELEHRRGDLRTAGFTLAGAGLHPESVFADVEIGRAHV